MIKIDPSIEPDYLSSDAVRNALNRIRARVNANQFPAIEKADELWRNGKVTDELYDSHHGKCCYCERKRDRKREMDVEHYRPKGKLENDEDHNGYWWLVFKWNNLLWSCKTCNQEYKRVIFTLLPGSTRAYEEANNLNLEKPHLINPKLEDPSQFLSFHIDRNGGRHFIRVVPRGGIDIDDVNRANESIRIVRLNRQEPGYNLIEERGETYSGSSFELIALNIMRAKQAGDMFPENRQIYVDAIDAYREQLRKFIRSDRVFSGVYRDYLRRHDIEYASLL